ncbi:MAG TPA: tetratricopeptide repeat protein, partial [Pirellulales bacterium]
MRRFLLFVLLLAVGCLAGCKSKGSDFSNVPFSQLSDMQPVRKTNNGQGESIMPAAFDQPGPKIDSEEGTSVKDVKPKKEDVDAKSDDPWWTSLKPSNVAKKWKKLIHQEPNETIARKAYTDGNELFQHGQFSEAAKRYKVAYKRWPDTDLEEDAMFMRAEALFFS